MRHGDERREVEHASSAVDPVRSGGDCSRQDLEIPGRAGNVRLACEKLSVFLQELTRDAWPCRVIGAGDVAAICKPKPALYQGCLFVMGEGACLDVQGEIGPGSKAVFTRDAGLCVMQAKFKRGHFAICAMRGGGKMLGEARD
jgi:hypothetical protein